MRVAKSQNAFTEDGNIADGACMFAGLTLSSGNYECEIQDIIISTGREKKMADTLTHVEQFALR